MSDHIFRKALGIFSAAGIACGVSCAQAAVLPDPLQDEALSQTAENRTLVVAGGCFWGIEAVFQQVRGVVAAVSGYAGGTAETARYDIVSGGKTGHAEAVEITYNAAEITAGKLLKVFFSVAHDPTTLNYQGPDHGTQYRSAIFYTTQEQADISRKYIAQLDAAKVFSNPIVTQVEALEKFYPAEDYHQDYADKNPNQPYIVAHDLPKVENLKKALPELCKKE